MSRTDWSDIARGLRREARFDDRVVPCFPDRPRNLWAMVTAAAARNPQGEALVAGGRRLTWRETEGISRDWAAGFRRIGLKAGDRVALLVGNRLEFVFALYGAACIGAIVVPLSTRQQKPEIAYCVNDCGAAALVYDEEFAERLPAESDTPSLRTRVCTDRLGDFLRPGTDAGAPENPGEEETALILYTSGTTGRPKGAMLSNCNIVHSSMIYEACMDLTAADRSIAVVPLAHVTGVVANVTAMAQCAGALVILPEFKAANYLAVAAAERVTMTVMVPAMYNLCLLQADFAAYDLSAWRIGGYGGAPMPTATIERLAERLPNLGLINAYGSTETTSPSTIMPPALTATHNDSVGLECPGAEILAMDDDGRELPAGEVGELWIRSASVIKGYWRNEAATKESFLAGFWKSGDLGSVDAKGFVRVFDRKKDMINRGGLKIYSAEVESVLAGHPDVLEVAIVAKSCPVLGERVHAVVTPRGAAFDPQALRAWAAERLSDYKVPETVTVLSEPLPRNANGKVMKRQLRDTVQAAG